MPLPLTAESSDRQRATAFYGEDRIQSLGGLPRECALKYDNERRKGHHPFHRTQREAPLPSALRQDQGRGGGSWGGRRGC